MQSRGKGKLIYTDMNRRQTYINLVLFSIIFLLTIFKGLFPVITVPEEYVPMIEHPYPVSMAGALRLLLLISAIIINTYYLRKQLAKQ